MQGQLDALTDQIDTTKHQILQLVNIILLYQCQI